MTRRNYDLVERLMIFFGRSAAAKNRNTQREARRLIGLEAGAKRALRLHTGGIVGRSGVIPAALSRGETVMPARDYQKGVRSSEPTDITIPMITSGAYDSSPSYDSSSSCDSGYSGGGGDSGGSCGGGGGGGD